MGRMGWGARGAHRHHGSMKKTGGRLQRPDRTVWFPFNQQKRGHGFLKIYIYMRLTDKKQWNLRLGKKRLKIKRNAGDFQRNRLGGGDRGKQEPAKVKLGSRLNPSRVSRVDS